MIQEEWNEQIRQTFIDALEYPLMAIPEFLANKQKETGINKWYFFNRLSESCNKYQHIRWSLMENVKKGIRDIKDAEYSLSEITKGKVEKCKTLSFKKTSALDEELLEDLSFLITKAAHFDEKQPAYTSLQTVSFAEVALKYIYKQSRIQCGMEPIPPFTYDIPKEYIQLKKSKQEPRLIFNYYLSEPTPFLGYYEFEEAIRNLLLNSTCPSSLKQICNPLWKLGSEIADLWNEELQPIDIKAGNNDVIRCDHYIKFDSNNRTIAIIVSEQIKKRDSFALKMNYDLALFASRIANVIARDLQYEKKSIVVQEQKNPIYNSFDELFKEEYKSRIEKFIQLLKETEKPCIHENYNYNASHKQKTVFVVWYESLEYKQVIHSNLIDRSKKAQLLSQKFPGLDIKGSTFSCDTLIKTREDYKSHFNNEIDKIKNPK